jgi:hypothetical protein
MTTVIAAEIPDGLKRNKRGEQINKFRARVHTGQHCAENWAYLPQERQYPNHPVEQALFVFFFLIKK